MRWCRHCGKLFDNYTRHSRVCDVCKEKNKQIGLKKTRAAFERQRRNK